MSFTRVMKSRCRLRRIRCRQTANTPRPSHEAIHVDLVSINHVLVQLYSMTLDHAI